MFVLSTDACKYGLGAVLSQIDDEGEEKVISYASRATKGVEPHYGATKLECLAAVWATEHFRHYLIGRPFKIVTDHSALRWLYNQPNPQGILARWLMKMQEYTFTVQYKKGGLHRNADGLSRMTQKGVDDSNATRGEIHHSSIPIPAGDAFFTRNPVLTTRA